MSATTSPPRITFAVFELWLCLAAANLAYAVGIFPLPPGAAYCVGVALFLITPLLALILFLIGVTRSRANVFLAITCVLIGSIVLFVQVASFISRDAAPFQEKWRVANPSGDLDAVGGVIPTFATNSIENAVYIVRHGQPVGKAAAFTSYEEEGLAARWLGDRALLIAADAIVAPSQNKSTRVGSGPAGLDIELRYAFAHVISSPAYFIDRQGHIVAGHRPK
jgi:hypothetical protein